MDSAALRELASRIQYTLVETGITQEQVAAVCAACVEHGFHAAMLPGCWVPTARNLLSDGKVRIASTVDFPLGIMSTRGKAAEAAALVAAGADELDITVNIGFLRSGMDSAFEEDIAAVVEAAAGRPVKVMLELPLLTPEQRDHAVRLAVRAGARYLKNASSGAVGVATPEEIRWLSERAGDGVAVKASGGIRTRQQVVELIQAGAELVGTSAAIRIIAGEEATSDIVY